MKKFNQVLLFIFILFLPTQLGKHFFLPFSYLSGVRVDYLAPTIYLTDIIALILIAVNVKTVINFFRQRLVLLFMFGLLINVCFSILPAISIFRCFEILEWLAVFSILNKKVLSPQLIMIGLFSTSVVELLLVILQFINKHSIQGIFYFLGERYMTLSTPGIAKAALNGIEILRPYGTFSHPNSLAGFYLLVYFFVLLNKKLDKFILLKNFMLLFSSFLILFSFSKIAIVLYLILNTLCWILNTKKCRLCLIAKILVVFTVSLIFLQSSGDPLSLSNRIYLFQNAIKIITSHPVFGVGLGAYLIAQSNYPSRISYFFQQPVHNVFILFIAEAGLIISLFVFWRLFFWIRKMLKKDGFIFIAAVVLITGLFDHYWLTLQQNLLLLAVVFGDFTHEPVPIKSERFMVSRSESPLGKTF